MKRGQAHLRKLVSRYDYFLESGEPSKIIVHRPNFDLSILPALWLQAILPQPQMAFPGGFDTEKSVAAIHVMGSAKCHVSLLRTPFLRLPKAQE